MTAQISTRRIAHAPVEYHRHPALTYAHALPSQAALAPDLETLAFVRGQWKGVDKLHISFPRLRELTLVDSCPEFLLIEDVPLEQAPIFPALERLHTVEHFYARPMDFRQWAPHAPALTHLRCSGLHYHNSPTAVSLQEIACKHLSSLRHMPCQLIRLPSSSHLR